MLKKLILVAFLLVVYKISFAQNQQKVIDSLLKVNSSYLKEDTVKAKLLNNISRAYQDVDDQKSLVFADQAFKIAEKQNHKRIIAESLLLKGVSLNTLYRYQEANNVKEKALAIYQELKLGMESAMTLYNLGLDYYRLNEWYKGLDYFLKSYETIKPLNKPFGEISCLIQIGNTYFGLSDYRKAIDYQFKALKIAEKINNKRLISSCYVNIANNYFILSDQDKALDYFKKALALKESILDKPGMAVCLGNIASVYENMAKYDLAILHYERSLKLSEETGNKLAEIQNLNGIGKVKLNQGKYDEALSYHFKALKINEDFNIDDHMNGDILMNLTEVYMETGKIDLAESNLQKAEQIYKKLGALDGQRNVLMSYSNLYERQKQYGKAYESYKSYIVIRDSLINNEVKNQATRKEMQFSYDKMESTYLLKAQLANSKLQQQETLTIQQRQQLLLGAQKLKLSDQEKTVQRLVFLKKQAEQEQLQERQNVVFKEKQLQAKYETSIRDKQISKQKQQIAYDQKVKALLIISLFLLFLIIFLVYYNQRKTARLNKVINVQKQELEHLSNVKNQIFSVVSHDMRSPVNALISFIQLLEHGNISTEKMQIYSATLKGQLMHTSILMDNLLNWAASQMQGFNPKFEPLRLKELINEVSVGLSAQINEKNIQLKTEIEEGLSINTDYNMLGLVIRNLISNAAKFTHQNGLIAVKSFMESDGVHIVIADQGVGMSKEQIDTFNSSNRLNTQKSTLGTNSEKGTGLGLLLCKNFIEILHGRISVESKKDKGSTFTIVIS